HVPQRSHRVDVFAAFHVGEDGSLTMAEHQLRHRPRGAAQVTLRMQPVRTVQLVEPAHLISRQRGTFHVAIMTGGRPTASAGPRPVPARPGQVIRYATRTLLARGPFGLDSTSKVTFSPAVRVSKLTKPSRPSR